MATTTFYEMAMTRNKTLDLSHQSPSRRLQFLRRTVVKTLEQIEALLHNQLTPDLTGFLSTVSRSLLYQKNVMFGENRRHRAA